MYSVNQDFQDWIQLQIQLYPWSPPFFSVLLSFAPSSFLGKSSEYGNIDGYWLVFHTIQYPIAQSQKRRWSVSESIFLIPCTLIGLLLGSFAADQRSSLCHDWSYLDHKITSAAHSNHLEWEKLFPHEKTRCWIDKSKCPKQRCQLCEAF